MALFQKKTEAPRELPTHIAIIMDGNGRWAKKRGLPRTAGHKVGAEAFRTIANYAKSIGLRYLTVYAFSTENWKRSEEEVSAIMDLLERYLREAIRDMDKNRVRLVSSKARYVRPIAHAPRRRWDPACRRPQPKRYRTP